MALGLNRIWVRFGLWITATVLVTIGALTAGVLLISELQYRAFYKHLPDAVRTELDTLTAQDLDDSPRALQIYSEYWGGDLHFGEKWSLLVGLAVSLPFGLGVGFWVSRRITRPLASMVEVAKRIEAGDLGARAVKSDAHGEMAAMIDTFNGMVEALETLESERKATAASISHELRTPLTVLQVRLHALCDGVIEVNSAELQVLLAQTAHLARLVDDLHTLSMADAGQLSLNRQRLDLADLVGEVVEHIHPQLQMQDMTLNLDLPVELGDGAADINADADRMRQIVNNLIGNVLRHARDGRWLGVSVTTESNARGEAQVVLRISDAGPGLPAELRSHPFQRFAQAPGKRRKEGSGLGLSIVKALTTSQGGTVEADTSERGGTRFTLRFPPIR
ncbi:MAG: ATP-binding protein [Comamonas sp.]